MTEKKDKKVELLGGAQPFEATPETETAKNEQAAAEHQHDVFTENIEARRCPYHGLDLKIQTEKRKVKKLDKSGRETTELKEITVKFAVCACVTPGTNNPYRGIRVWEQT